MSQRRDVDRFNRWAGTYDRHWMQRRIFEPIQRTVLELAAEQDEQPAAILDVGCGTGQLLRAAELRYPGAKLEGVDAAAEMVNQAAASRPAGSTIGFQQATAEELPFPDGEFDLVFSTMTFHHWNSQRTAIAEVARVLTPKGRWLLADFVAVGWIKYVRRLLRQHRFPDHAVLEGMLSEAGLESVEERRVPGLGGQVAVIVIARA